MDAKYMLGRATNQKRRLQASRSAAIGCVGANWGNLNQIARQVNTVDSDIEKLRAFAELAMIREQLQGILATYDS